MKKFNYNIIVFVVCMVLIGAGFTKEYFNGLWTATKQFFQGELSSDTADGFAELTKKMETVASEELRYHDRMMALDSIKLRMTNTRIVVKEETTLVKSSGGSLVTPQTTKITQNRVNECVDRVELLKDAAEKNGASFLYVAAPRKGYGFSLPANMANYEVENYTMYVNGLKAAGIPTLDLAAAMTSAGMMNEDSFFLTDHHWKPTVGLWAAKQVGSTLREKYGFNHDPYYMDPENYSVQVYEDLFLGSYGLKAGRYFTKGGLEDIDILDPKFETKLSVKCPYNSKSLSGNFQETLMNMDFVNPKGDYSTQCYMTYTGGNYRLEIIRNELKPDGEKVLLIHDSFACAVTPFLALETGELHAIDLRDFIPSKQISVLDYIEKIQPDHVVVLYSGVGMSEGRSEFN